MDWMRRNWPDLVIAIALVAVIAGIVLTLITGGTLFPLGGGTAPRSAPDVAAPRSTSAATRPSTAGAPATDTRNADPVISPLPPIDAGAGVAAGDAAGGATDEPPAGATTTPVRNEAPAEAPRTTTPAATAERTAPAPPAAAAEGRYRVSVGAFGNEENAERLAATFRQDGFPVFIGTQGDLSLVLVGPYDSETEAERAAERVRAGDYGVEPVIYQFRPDAGTTATAPRPAPAPAAAANGRFVQVGAYGSAEAAQPQRERLEALGFDVSQRSEGGFVKLLVGPFAGDALADARARLESEGIDHFVR